MIVTRIEAVSRSRSKIYLDDSFAFVLNKGELHLYGIREGEELKEEAYRDILENLLGKRATVRCMNLLKALHGKTAQGQAGRGTVSGLLCGTGPFLCQILRLRR